MKKSKIKKVVSIKEWKSQNGVIHYHNLEMENGDKNKIYVGSQGTIPYFFN